ncbi:MAG: pirin family protein [Sandaracinaceae bacterium]
MLNIRRSHDRGAANHGWLETRHTFSFARYYDPAHMGFRSLRVINEDRVSPGRGFGTHGHRDMEILSYVLAGALEHEDSLGTGSVIRPGEIQRMTAGTGVRHSEYNHSKDEPVHFLQIWIEPSQKGLAPSYEQCAFDAPEGEWTVIASPDGDHAVTLHQDVRLFVTRLTEGRGVSWQRPAGRHAWLHVARGSVAVSTGGAPGETLSAGDAASTSDAPELNMTGMSADAEVLLFDLA